MISYYECCTKLGFEGIHNEPESLLAFERQPRAFWEWDVGLIKAQAPRSEGIKETEGSGHGQASEDTQAVR